MDSRCVTTDAAARWSGMRLARPGTRQVRLHAAGALRALYLICCGVAVGESINAAAHPAPVLVWTVAGVNGLIAFFAADAVEPDPPPVSDRDAALVFRQALNVRCPEARWLADEELARRGYRLPPLEPVPGGAVSPVTGRDSMGG